MISAQRTLGELRRTARHVQQPGQIRAADIKHLVVVRQGRIKVCVGKAAITVGLRLLRRILRVRIAAPGQVVIDNTRQQQNTHIEHYRERGQLCAFFWVEHDEQGHSGPRWMQAAQRHHYQHGSRYGQRCRH